MKTPMELWSSVSKPPKEALKTITGGRLKGMTDINPQWRYKALTEIYGLCGIGWKYTIDKLWTEQGPDGVVAAFSQVSLYIMAPDMDRWSDAIPGIGGSLFIADEREGLRMSDEAYKMATTDALSVAMKMIGIASEIYEGRWDGSKYSAVPESKPLQTPPPVRKPVPLTAVHIAMIQKELDTREVDPAPMFDFYGVTKVSDLLEVDFDKIMTKLKTKPMKKI